MTDQLAFQFSEPSKTATAELIAFPADRMRGHLRDAAAFILSKPEAKRAWHFKNQVGRVWDDLKRQRLSNDVAGAETRAFAVALECEMRKQLIFAIMIQQRGGAA